jgi:hypothetical protein
VINTPGSRLLGLSKIYQNRFTKELSGEKKARE